MYATSFVDVWTLSKPATWWSDRPVARIDYYDDPNAPEPTSIVIAASAFESSEVGWFDRSPAIS